MQRYFLETPFDIVGTTLITGDDSKHISRVMRMDVGDKVIAVSNGNAYIATIFELLPDSVSIRREEGPLPTNEMPVHVTIACGLPKGDKLDLIVQKGTELGMKGIIPFKAERSVVKWDDKRGAKKIERLRKIAKEAAEQCHRAVIPEVENPLTIRQLLQLVNTFDVLLFADEEDAKSGEPHRIADRLKNVYLEQKVLVVFGPEGGLSRTEAEALRAAGFHPTSLGPRILRTETAPLYLLSAMSCEFE
ncbi:16S rRNA (uracil(1498)-N(3))-methyltransferase [Sporosarcina sp. G11-34]|uniref:16S rRNA (uracil(1498)-N(3))-methyltransferase n=1 Tax=Sporosarcina sp. G11-34 TaxID=2849605 RepID=UPI0022A9F180|nr:16S rRNA (uracil(1498)-N(3))-methyltransferase [Sporosarcina sp. G11-34]MCZ2259368.1 16S rRNA (uracil(1498)-N(3))-methyltransferase [Sporosarcina sp. G11-34]